MSRPDASTVIAGTCVVVPYEPAVTPVVDILAVVIALSATSAVAIVPSAIFADVIADGATLGFGYDPVRSPPAIPPGVVPVIAMLVADVTRPLVSTESIVVYCCPPYTPGVTPVGLSFSVVTCSFAIFAVDTELSARSALRTSPSTIFSDVMAFDATLGPVTAASRICGFGYTPVRSPPAGPAGGTDTMSTFRTVTTRPAWST